MEHDLFWYSIVIYMFLFFVMILFLARYSWLNHVKTLCIFVYVCLFYLYVTALTCSIKISIITINSSRD